MFIKKSNTLVNNLLICIHGYVVVVYTSLDMCAQFDFTLKKKVLLRNNKY